MAGAPSELASKTLRWALSDADTIARYRSHVRQVPGSSCAWWCGALSGRGHGRFWLARAGGQDLVVIAHRFAFGLIHGIDELLATRVLGHGCDNPLCQQVDERHVRASSPLLNRREWAARRRVSGSAVNDRRGARGRARALRDAVLAGGAQIGLVDALGRDGGVQMPLWGVDPQGRHLPQEVVGAGRDAATGTGGVSSSSSAMLAAMS